MVKHGAPDAIDQALGSIIGEMQAIQRQIASGSQPASMHELDELKKLGQQYARVIEALQQGR